MSNKDFIFNLASLVAHCQKVDAETPEGTTPDYSPVFHADIGHSRKAANCIWANITATDAEGHTAPLRFRFRTTTSGSIDPATAEGVAKANEWRSKNNFPLIDKARERAPQLPFTYYTKAPTVLENDKLTIDPAAELPPVNELGYLFSCLNTWFVLLISTLRAEGRIQPEDQMPDTPVPGVVYAPSTKICPLMQTHVSRKKAGPNSGKKLPNPIGRIRMNMQIGPGTDQSGLPKQWIALDGSKVDTNEHGVPVPAPLLSPSGDSLTDANIHELIPSGSDVAGVVKMTSICFSNMGISVPTNLELAVVKAPVRQKQATVEDLIAGGGDFADMLGGLAVAPVTATPAAASAAAVPVAAAPVAAASTAAVPVAAAPVAAAPAAVVPAPVAVAPVAAAPARAPSAAEVDALLAGLEE